MYIVLAILVGNTVLAVVYLICSLLANKNKQNAVLLSLVLFACPVVGFLGFGLTSLLYWLNPKKGMDISGIYFRDEQIRHNKKIDYREGIDVAPLQDVIRLSGKNEKREKMLASIKSDIQTNLNIYNLAVINPDSEVSHYAAAILLKTRNAFDHSLRKLSHEYDQDRADAHINLEYLGVVDELLNCGIYLASTERKKHLYTFVHLCTNLYEHHIEKLTDELLYKMIDALIELQEERKCRIWITKLREEFPRTELTYTCELNFYYKSGEPENFFATLDELKRSNIPIGPNSIDLIRFFSSRFAS